jgi:hypothetical protein
MSSNALGTIVMTVLGFVMGLAMWYAVHLSNIEMKKHEKDFKRWQDQTREAISKKTLGDLVVYKGKLWMVMGKRYNEENEHLWLVLNEVRLGVKLPEGFLVTQADNSTTTDQLDDEVAVPYYWK